MTPVGPEWISRCDLEGSPAGRQLCQGIGFLNWPRTLGVGGFAESNAIRPLRLLNQIIRRLLLLFARHHRTSGQREAKGVSMVFEVEDHFPGSHLHFS